MSEITMVLILGSGAAIAIAAFYIGGQVAKRKAEKTAIKIQQQELKRQQEESNRRKKANEQKESLETGSAAADFDNSVAAINQLRNNKKAARK